MYPNQAVVLGVPDLRPPLAFSPQHLESCRKACGFGLPIEYGNILLMGVTSLDKCSQGWPKMNSERRICEQLALEFAGLNAEIEFECTFSL